MLEMRDRTSDKKYRAHLGEAKVPFTGRQTLMFGGGQLQMDPDEVLFIDDVVEVFRAFFNAEKLSDHVMWRDMTSILNG